MNYVSVKKIEAEVFEDSREARIKLFEKFGNRAIMTKGDVILVNGKIVNTGDYIIGDYATIISKAEFEAEFSKEPEEVVNSIKLIEELESNLKDIEAKAKELLAENEELKAKIDKYEKSNDVTIPPVGTASEIPTQS